MTEARSEARLLQRGLAVLSVVGQAAHPPGFGDIRDRTGLPKATLSRILSALRRAGYLALDPGEKGYVLGPEFMNLIPTGQPHRARLGEIRDELQRLTDELELPILYWLVTGERISPASRFLPFSPRAETPDGRTERLDRAAPGLAVLAAMDSIGLSRALARFREAEKPPAPETARRLGFAAATGFAVVSRPVGANGAPEDHAPEVAAAITDVEGRPVAAISVRCIAAGHSEAERHQIGRKLAFTARQLSHGPRAAPRRRDVGVRTSGGSAHSVEEPEVVSGGHYDQVGTSPCWDTAHRRLIWLDSLGGAISWTAAEDAGSVPGRRRMPDLPGAVLPSGSGRVMVASRDGISVLDLGTGRRSVFSHPEPEDALRRFSTAQAAPEGQLWVGSLSPVPLAGMGQGRLYRMDPGGQIRRALDLERGAKGMCWSADGRHLFLTEAGSKAILRFEMDERRERPLNPRRFAVHRGEGTPNGIAMDREGCLWAAIYGGWCVARFDPDGREIETVELPVPLPTALCFGGPNLRSLFVTTCRLHVPPEVLLDAPESGAVFRVETTVPGLRVPELKLA
ncbi:SMP-30/gluconolactonase/LRE family protein [Halovulum sp. GXIMD14794]